MLDWVRFHDTLFDHSAHTRPLQIEHMFAQETRTHSTIVSVNKADPWKAKSRQTFEVCRVWVGCVFLGLWLDRSAHTCPLEMDICMCM